jgi:molybdenum-dependent DNA-binding transcriptional regulator ModE
MDNPENRTIGDMDPLDGVAAFARVVESGSFSAAARRLRISKSAASAHVQRLEERLGVRLLHRTTRRISLTEAGAAYYRHCARIVAEAEAAEQAARALQREPRGMLSMSAPDTFGPMHVAPAIPEFLPAFQISPSTFRSRPGTSIWCKRALTSPFALERSRIHRSSCAGWRHRALSFAPRRPISRRGECRVFQMTSCAMRVSA